MKKKHKWEHSLITVSQETTVHLLIKLQAPVKEYEDVSTPINLCLVLDRSGSMAGDKLQETIESVKMIIANLRNDDILSVVIFGDLVNTLIPPQKVTSSRDHLLKAVEGIKAAGSTNLSGGLLMGIEHLNKSKTDDSINRLLLLTDGCANAGITDPKKLVNLVRSAKQENSIITTTLGFGEEFNEDLLIEMANSATGNFYYIQNVDDAPKFFSEELHGIQQVVAQNIVVEIQPETKIVEKIEQTSSHVEYMNNTNLFVELGDAIAGEEKKILFAMEIPKIKKQKNAKIAQIQIRMVEITEDKVRTTKMEQDVFVNSEDEGNEDFAQMKVEILQELALHESVKERHDALDDMGKAIKHADPKSAEAAAKRLLAVAGKLAALPDNIRNKVIEDEIKDLRQQADALIKAAEGKDDSLTDVTQKIRKLTATNTMSIARSKLKKHHDSGSIKDKAFKTMLDKLNKKDNNKK